MEMNQITKSMDIVQLNLSVNKASKISNITASHTILRTIIFGYKINETDPE